VGRYRAILEEELNAQTTMAFFSAVYFTGNWRVPFNALKTSDISRFTMYGNRSIDCQLMTRVGFDGRQGRPESGTPP
jgi:serine protease inhibitor